MVQFSLLFFSTVYLGKSHFLLLMIISPGIVSYLSVDEPGELENLSVLLTLEKKNHLK